MHQGVHLSRRPTLDRLAYYSKSSSLQRGQGPYQHMSQMPYLLAGNVPAGHKRDIIMLMGSYLTYNTKSPVLLHVPDC